MKDQLDVGQIVRENAREQIGSPRPSRTHSSHRRRAERSRAQELAHAQELAEWEKPEPDPEKIVEGAPLLAQRIGAFTRPLTTLPVAVLPWQRKHMRATCFQYSPEVIHTANLIRQAHGEKAMREYLSSLKEKTQMNGHLAMAETLTHQHEERKIEMVGGSIETALNDALAKEAHYTNEAHRMQGEAERWHQVADSLREVIRLTTQPLAKSNGKSNGNGHSTKGQIEKVHRGYWEEQVRMVLKAPMTKTDLFAALRLQIPKDHIPRMYPSIGGLYGKGVLVEVDGKVCLADWTTPSSQLAS